MSADQLIATLLLLAGVLVAFPAFMALRGPDEAAGSMSRGWMAEDKRRGR